jgi:hypothetical protein
VPAPIPKKISQILPTFQNVAQTSNYLVKFALPPHTSSGGYSLGSHLRSKGVDFRFVGDEIGMLCSNASLPGSAMASVDVVGNYQGVVERFAHTRNFTQISLEFYVDNKYKTLKFLEHWMEYISGANPNSATEQGYHFKMRYPDLYKSNETRIIKFEKNYRQFLEYKFIGLFPLSLNSVRVGYQNSQVLKATCNFSYDRYICGRSTSAAHDAGVSENNDPNNGYVWHKGSLDYVQDKIGNTTILNSPTGQTDTVNTVQSDPVGLREWTTDQPITGPGSGWKYFAN